MIFPPPNKIERNQKQPLSRVIHSRQIKSLNNNLISNSPLRRLAVFLASKIMKCLHWISEVGQNAEIQHLVSYINISHIFVNDDTFGFNKFEKNETSFFDFRTIWPLGTIANNILTPASIFHGALHDVYTPLIWRDHLGCTKPETAFGLLSW
jgi:hypothetical protein